MTRTIVTLISSSFWDPSREAAAVMQNLEPPAPRHLNHELKGYSRG